MGALYAQRVVVVVIRHCPKYQVMTLADVSGLTLYLEGLHK